MLEITVRPERSRRRVRPGVEEFADLVGALGAGRDKFLIVQHIPDIPEYFIQTLREDDGTYCLEYRDGGPDRQFAAVLDDAAAVAAAIVGWSRRAADWAAGIEWERLDLGPAAEVPPLELDDEDRESLEAVLRLGIAGGYLDRDQLAETACEYLEDEDEDDPPVSAAQARVLVDRLWLERVAEQAGWDGETDPERLTRAFEALDQAGITARENFFCCRTCGSAAIGDAGAPDARGFVYFHEQGTESAAEGHGLFLLYGGFDDSAETAAAIGHEVVAALAAVGLPTTWDGDPGRGILVSPLDWRKRLVG